MKIESRRLNKRKVTTLLLIIIFIIIIIIASGSSSKNKYKDITILFNNEFIKLNDKALVEEDVIYFSKNDIENLFDKNIYYNEAQKELITTFNTHITHMILDENSCIINDEVLNIEGKLQEVDGIIYIPISDIAVTYDLEIKYAENTNRVIMDSTNLKKVEATILKRASLKKKKGIFSSKLEKLIIGDKVVVIGESGSYKKVRSANGNIGYIKTKKLSDEVIVRQNKEYSKKQIDLHTGYSNMSGVYEDLKVDESKFNVVDPTLFYIDEDFKVLDKSSTNTATYTIYKEWADRNKLEILPKLENNESVSDSLFNYNGRSSIITSLRDMLKKYEYKGIIIDFDTIDDVNSFYRFIFELSARFKEADLITAVKLNEHIDKKKIESYVDYIIE